MRATKQAEKLSEEPFEGSTLGKRAENCTSCCLDSKPIGERSCSYFKSMQCSYCTYCCASFLCFFFVLLFFLVPFWWWVILEFFYYLFFHRRIMAAHVLPMPMFLPCPGELPVPFDMWMFNSYLLVMNAMGNAWPEALKRALLFHCLGAEGQRLFY